MIAKQSRVGSPIPAVFLGSLVATALATYIFTRGAIARMAVTSLVDPASVKDLAARIPAGSEDEFIEAAWDFVGRDIKYDGFGSLLVFEDSAVECFKCVLPNAVLERGSSNCVGKSLLLASLLRYRMPADRVYVAIGEHIDGAGELGGHAWVEMTRAGGVYLLEATSPPKGWLPRRQATNYVTRVLFNDEMVLCGDPEYCRMQFSVNQCVH